MGERYSDFNKNVGSNLQKIRKKAGYKSAKSFAEKIGLNPSTYTDYEQGKAMFSYERAWQIADALNCTIDELGGRQWPRPAYSDPRQESVNACFESMNDTGKETLATVARSLERDASNRIDVKKGGTDSRDPLSDSPAEDVA